MNPVRLSLSPPVLRRMLAVLDDPGGGFVALVRVAGLDPARDFRGAVLDGVDFDTDDLSGFDFSGADLSKADLSRARGLDKIVTDSGTILPEQPGQQLTQFNPAKVHDLILRGEVPPREWWPLITWLKLARDGSNNVTDLSPLAGLIHLRFLDLRGASVADLRPLSRLTALERLDLNRTQVSDLRPIAGLTNLKSLDLGQTKVGNVVPISRLRHLERLFLHNTPVKDVSALATLSRLRVLDLRGTSVRSMAPIRHVAAIYHDGDEGALDFTLRQKNLSSAAAGVGETRPNGVMGRLRKALARSTKPRTS